VNDEQRAQVARAVQMGAGIRLPITENTTALIHSKDVDEAIRAIDLINLRNETNAVLWLALADALIYELLLEDDLRPLVEEFYGKVGAMLND